MSAFIIELLLKSTVLLLIPLGLSLLRRRLSADLRSKLTIIVLMTLAVLPFAMALGPEMVVWQTDPIPAMDDSALSVSSQATRSYSTTTAATGIDTTAGAPAKTPADLLAMVLLLGTAAMIAMLLLRYWRTSRSMRALTEIEPGRLRREFEDLRVELCPERSIRLGWQSSSSSTVTWGVFESTIGLPPEICQWPAEKRKAAFVHEIAHVMRNDCASILFARFVVAMFWWHPLAWKALASLKQDIECATDDQVLSYGVYAKPYARFLVEVASRPVPSAGFGIAMARNGSTLRHRIDALIATRQRRSTMTRTTQLAAVLIGLTGALLISGMQVEAAPSPESDRGSIRLYSAAPSYPRDALADSIEGYVDLQFDVNANGATENIRVLNQVPDTGVFAQAAIDAMRTFRYLPKIENGEAVIERDVRTRLQFSLNAKPSKATEATAPAAPSEITEMASTITQTTRELKNRLNQAALEADRDADGERFLDLAEESYRAQPEMASYFLLRATQLGTDRPEELAWLKAVTLYELGDLERSLVLFEQLAQNEAQAEAASGWIGRIEYQIKRRERVYEELLSQRD